MAENWLTRGERQAILAAIQQAESVTSGEIRLHLDRKCKDHNVLDRAAHVFARLSMHKTKDRNGVLIYLALDDHKYAIIGDAGINARVPDDFWQSTSEHMRSHFATGDIVAGIVQGIREAGEQLAQFFPVRKDDINELSDEISFGE